MVANITLFQSYFFSIFPFNYHYYSSYFLDQGSQVANST